MEIKERDLEVTLPYILRLLGQRYHFQVLQPAMKMTDEQLYLKGVIEYGRMKFAFDTCLKAGIERGYPYIEMVRGKVDGPWLKGDLYELAKRYLGHLRDIQMGKFPSLFDGLGQSSQPADTSGWYVDHRIFLNKFCV